MKSTLIFGVVLCFVLAVLSRRPEPTLQPYPVVFSASFNESDLVIISWDRPRMNNVFVDLPNKRASINYASTAGQTESWTLIYKPQGADPTAPASQGYTMFNVNPDYPAQVPNNCMYMTGEPMTLAPFPSHWQRYETHYSQEVSTWFDLPNDLVYGGEYFIAELGVNSDRWDTQSQCILEQSGIGQVPCTSVMFSQGPNPLPLMDIRAFGARKHSFETDKYKVRVYHSFTTSVQDSDFTLPNNWEVNCGNDDNSFMTTPDYAITVYNNGGPDAPLTIALASPPVASLGDVKVYLSPTPTWYYNCADCVSFSNTPLIFNHNNWNVSQTVPLTFSHNGCSQYAVKATGGGYDWTYYGRTLTIYTCEGENFDGCITKPKCGDSSIFTN
jgi:hypothetical protein